MNFQPLGDRVLVRRLPAPKGVIDTSAGDDKAGGGMILVEGEILAVGPGRWVPGEWWKVGDALPLVNGIRAIVCGDIEYNEHGVWEWIAGHYRPVSVQPGQKIIFNARWNDFANEELCESGPDKSGPLERPMPQWQWGQRDLHLITEGDIAGILG